MEFHAVVKPIVTPASSQEPPPEQFSSPKTYSLLTSAAPIDVQPFTDLAELNNRVVTLARQFNMSVEDLLRGGHVVVFAAEPARLAQPAPITEVLRVE